MRIIGPLSGAERRLTGVVRPLPPRAYADSMHITVAAARDMTCLLTWNCKHIAGPRLVPRIERACTASGYDMPSLCTPAERLRGG